MATPDIEISKIFRLIRDDAMGRHRRPAGALHLWLAAGAEDFFFAAR